MIESIVMGVLPLAWQGSPLDSAARSIGWMLTSASTEEQIKKHIEMALTDRGFYDSTLALFQKELEGHVYENSEKYFNAIVSWMERNC